VATAVTERFDWRDSAAGHVLTSAPLEGLAPHVFTTRELSFRGPDAGEHYRRLAVLFDAAPSNVVTVSQVHGRSVAIVRPDLEVPSPTATADAIVSFDPERVIAVRVADCVPMLIADRQRRVVAAVHAGWRGTCVGVVTAAIEAIADAGVPASDLTVAIGPSIGPCCYQVDDRVRLAFLGMTPDAAAWFTEDGPGRWRLDLWRANRDQLEDTGVAPDRIHAANICTADNLDRCFSYRKEGAGTGRMIAAIRLANG
jgi:YfiH family protein